ncbi:glutathione S-transferase [Mesobaculum littorinae]|uniref:Glutathione S-transferase n=1 Tax=Mesobaculum littorinae TaxID=2486419 RepID=A0A438AG06_9RHOB|nr:glutathione S-transferase [Mesobaculum littorinae]RVV97651.1 glutathione S-transferase [Mesobaculum littorinae]
MQLYHAPASPFVRKVMLVLHETGQLDQVDPIAARPQPIGPADPVAGANPLGKIPTLVRPDGPALYDSRVICRYLDARAGGRLYPEARIWETLTLEAMADGIMEAALLLVYEARDRAPEAQSADYMAGQWDKIDRALDAIEERWMAHLAANRRDIGHLAVAAALGYLDFRHADHGWRSARPALAAWYARAVDWPAMVATAPG